MQYYIKEREWEVIFEKLQTIKGLHVKQELLLCKFIEGVWYISRSARQWRLLPKEYRHYRAIHMRFKL